MAIINFNYQALKSLESPDKRIEVFDERENGLGLRVTPGGTKTFFYRYRVNNKIRRYTIGQFDSVGVKDARNVVSRLRVMVLDGLDPQAERQKKKNINGLKTFSDLVEEFKEKYLPTLRENTQIEYNRIIDKELLPVFGKLPAVKITKHEIVEILDKKAYKDGSPTMANRIRSRLSRIFTFGMERGHVEVNPIQNVSTYKQGESKRHRYYSEEEIRKLWGFFEDWGEPTQSVLQMLLICGQRKTETMKMRWADIQGEVWTIPASLAKNKHPHDVPLSPMALEIIDRMKKINGKSEYVFASPQNKKAPLDSMSRVRQAIQNNTEVSDFRPHDLRRTVATYMAKLGIERTVLGKILNHKGLAGDGQVTAIYDRHSYMGGKA
ncbi:tyrosine-type recombinase/integrase [Halalkalibaculum sp. DA3122]|uniref:tyrosine-type recombinase/integrase n=1 Tax=Halalkalibaculum sp. DA3122 TaxID=3373607 RepID=UPI003754B0CA